MVLFPEGGFLHKRIVKGQEYARKNNLPILHNITLPRLGALNGIRDILIDPQAAAVAAQESKSSLLQQKEQCEWIWLLKVLNIKLNN